MRPREESFAARQYREMGLDPEKYLRQNGREHRKPTPMSAAELLGIELPPVKWAVPGVLPEGVTTLAGKPKMGKSWLGVGICVSVAAGGPALGKIATEQGGALYLGLEDNKRRLQRRLKKILAGRSAPEGLEVYWEWPRLDEGGLEDLRAYLQEHPNCRLVVIDTLKKIRPRSTQNRSLYDLDYEALEPLLPLAAEYGVAMLIVHHLRKLEAGDPLDMISGSTGLTAGIDGALVLKRDRGKQDATLLIDGRDIEEPKELALRWDADIASWSLMGEAEEFRLSEERQAILDALRSAGVPLAPKDIAERVDKPDGNVRKLLHGMRDDGQVIQHGTHPRYKYTPTGNGNDGNDGNDGNGGNGGNDTNVTGRARGGNDKSSGNSAYLSGSRHNDTNVTVVTHADNDMHSESLPKAGEAKEGEISNTSSNSSLSSSSSALGESSAEHVVAAAGVRLTPGEVEEVKRLAAQGHMSYADARRAVLAQRDPRRRGFSDLSLEKDT